MNKGFWVAAGAMLFFLGTVAFGQIDPEPRHLIQVGFNQPMEGQGPIAGYGFFYYNKPGFVLTNLTLRAAVAPVYLDTELGVSKLLGENTDMGFGLAGGGFADNYSEIRQGKYLKDQSFVGDSAETSVSVYHLFDPNREIPLYGIVKAGYHRSFFDRDSDTADNFAVPEDFGTLRLRTGLRFGGREPSLTSPMAMEISVWYEAFLRDKSGGYGFADDRYVNPNSHLFWARSLLKYTFTNTDQYIDLGITGGLSLNADRFSAYRLGGLLPLVSEFPLSIPGYYFQEITAKRFGLVNGEYSFPIAPNRHWRASLFGAGGVVDYLDGFEQGGIFHSGVGAGVTYVSPARAWFVTLVYGHGFNAVRHGEEGANNIGIVFQYDFDAKKRDGLSRFAPEVNPYSSQAGERLFK